MDKNLTAMNLAYWSDLGSRLGSLHIQPAGDEPDPAANLSESHWISEETAIANPLLAQLLTYWRDNRQHATMPPTTAIDPFNLRFALGNLVVLEPLRDGVDFKVRLYGSRLAHRVGYDLTGKQLSAVEDPLVRRATEQSAARVLLAARPLLLQRRRRLDGREVEYTCLFLPFGDAAPTRIIIGITYGDDLPERPQEILAPL